jgi:hypothetical protein
MTDTDADVLLGQLPASNVRQLAGCPESDGADDTGLSTAGGQRIVW